MSSLTPSTLFQHGNAKLSSFIHCWSITAKVSCPGATADCLRNCYAARAYGYHPSVKVGHDRRLDLVKRDPSQFFDMAHKRMSYLPAGQTFRVHVSGDFFSQDYLDLWTQLISLHPEHQFYGYTKSRNLLDFWGLDRLENANFVDSYLPDGGVNFGPEAEILQRASALGVPVCPYRKGHHNPVCGTECRLCVTAPYVAFVQH